MPLLPKLIQSHYVSGFDGSRIISCIVSNFDVVIDCSEAEKGGHLRTISLQTGEKRKTGCEFLRNRQCHAVLCEQSPLGIFLIFLLSYFDKKKHRKSFVFVCGQLTVSNGNLTVEQVGNEHPCMNSPEKVKWFSFQRDADGTIYLVIQWYGSKQRPHTANDSNNPPLNSTMFHLINLKLRSFSAEEIKSQGLIESSVILAFGQDIPGKCKRAYISNREICFPRIGNDQEVRIAVTGCDKPGIMSEYGTETERGKSDEPLRCGDFLITYNFDKEKQMGIIWADDLCLQHRTAITSFDKHVICDEEHQLVADDNGAIYLLGKCAEGCSHIYKFHCSKPGRPVAERISPTASQMVALTAMAEKSFSSPNTNKSNKINIIHGPPSSGKSTVFWLMLQQVISEGKKVLLYLLKADDKAEYETLFQTRDLNFFIGLIDKAFILENIATDGILFINRIPHLTYEQKNYLLVREEPSVVVIDDDIPTPLQQPRKRINWMHLSAVIGNEQQKSSAMEIKESLFEKCNRRWIKIYGRDDDSLNETKLIRFTENSECLSDGKRRGNDAELKFAKTFLKLNLGGYLFWGFDTQQFLIKIRKMKVLGRFYEELSNASRSHFEADFIFIHWHFGIHLIEVKAASEYKCKSPTKQCATEEDEIERKAKRLKFEVENTTETSAAVSTNAFPLNKAHTKAVFQLGKQYVVLNKISETFLGTELSHLHLHICCPNAIFPEEMKDENCSYIDKTILNDENRLNEYWNKWNLSISDKNIATKWQEKLKKFVVLLGAYDFGVLRKSAEKLDHEFPDNQNVSAGRYRDQYYGNALSAATATQTKSHIFSDQQSRISAIQIRPENNNINHRVTEILREGNPEVKTRILIATESADSDSATIDESDSGIYRPKNTLNHGKELIVLKGNLANIEDKVRELWKPNSVMVIAESEDVADHVRSYLANKGIPCGTINECGDFVIVDVEKPELEKSFWDIIIYLKSD